MSLINAIKDTLNGDFVSDETKFQRTSICRNCNFKRGSRCIKCSCFIELKTWVPSESCPMGKWNIAPAVRVPEVVNEEPVIQEPIIDTPVVETREPAKEKSIVGRIVDKVKKTFKK